MSAEAYRWRCACCGEEFTGLPMAMGFAAPSSWEVLDDDTRAASFLDSDFCKIARPGGEVERYICGLLLLPVPSISAEFQFIVWLSVSEKSWEAYSAGYGIGVYEAEGCFAYLANSIPGFELSGGLHANVWFEPDGLRPLVSLQDGDHPLIWAQQAGIDVQQIEEWAAIMHKGFLDD